jgi:hypothetical protein
MNLNFGATPISITTLSMTTLSTITPCIKGSALMTLSIKAVYQVSCFVYLMLNVIMPSVVMLVVIMLSVEAPLFASVVVEI